MRTAVFILAGGAGLRLWPLSRKETPKQFLPLLPDNKTFFEKTLERALKITDKDNIYVLTVEQYKNRILQFSPLIKEENIITESEKRNTAPSIAVAMMTVYKKYGELTAIIMPSDHYIPDEELFVSTVLNAVECAKKTEGIVTIGITPTRPATNYGYIKPEKLTQDGFYKVCAFTEKPELSKAQQFLLDGNYLWNSGIFIWNTSAILNEYKKYLPEVFVLAEKICNSDNSETKCKLYKEMPEISVDYGILEKCNELYTLRGNFPWDDIGSWDSFSNLCETDEDGNSHFGKVVNIDSSDCLTVSLENTTVTVGTRELCIINTGKCVLVFPKSKSEEILSNTHLFSDCDISNLL